MTNEDRIDFLVRTGKQTLEMMVAVDQGFNPTIVHEDMDGKINVILLEALSMADTSLLATGLARAAETPQAMVSLTADMITNKGEALQVLAAFVGQDDVTQVVIPYHKHGNEVHWEHMVLTVTDKGVAGGILAAVIASHASMS